MSSDTTASLFIWYLLVDSVNGEPYKGTSVSSVLRASLVAPLVVQFRRAVKAEYADSHLKRVASSDLPVYKNKSAFDKRNDSVLDEDDKPLKSSDLLDNLGATEEEALIVAVPPSHKKQKTNWTSSTKVARLTYVPSSPLFQLDSEYLADTGMPSSKLVLYCRPAFHQQFEFLQESVIA